VDLKILKPRSIVTRLIGTVADFSRNRADGGEILPAPFKEGRWWCIIQVPSALPTRSIQFPKRCGSSAATVGSALCSRMAEHGLSGWKSFGRERFLGEFLDLLEAEDEEDHRAGNMDMFRNRRHRKIYNVLVVKRPFLYIDPTSST
jgi:hypothetical protein